MEFLFWRETCVKFLTTVLPGARFAGARGESQPSGARPFSSWQTGHLVVKLICRRFLITLRVVSYQCCNQGYIRRNVLEGVFISNIWLPAWPNGALKPLQYDIVEQCNMPFFEAPNAPNQSQANLSLRSL
jgi:hypothetical protein